MAVLKQFQKYLGSQKTKNALVDFLVGEWASADVDFDLYIGYEKLCKRNQAKKITMVEGLYSNHFEADTRLILHAFHAANKDFSHVTIHSPDSDVFFILLSALQLFPDLTNVYIQTGGKNSRVINVSEIQRTVGSLLAKALLGYYV